MLSLYAWGTPNGRKPLILLEELGVPYELHQVDLRRDQQHAPEFLALNPNGKIPALVDGEGDARVVVWESGAILIHLAETHGRFLPPSGQARATTLAWLMFQMAGVGPIFGQTTHFRQKKLADGYAHERFVGESRRVYDVLERRLAEVDYVAGDYSIADMALYPWAHEPDARLGEEAPLPNVRRWIERVGARPAVEKAMAIPFGRRPSAT